MKIIHNKKKFTLDIIFIFIGCLIASLGVNLFLTHARLLSGGATGIALIIEYLTGFQSGYTVFLINIPLFFLSYKKLSKKFTLYSAIGMVSLSLSLIITKKLSSLFIINDILLYCIYGGILCGVGYAIVFLRNGSTGGTDIITMLIRKKYSNFNIGSLGLCLNSIIVIIGAIFLGFPKALYTLISILIQGIVLNKLIGGFSSKKLMLILTNKEDEVIEYILKDLNRGVTTLNATGVFSDSNKRMIYCIVNDRQMIYLKSKILKLDPTTFISILDVSEVRGNGFTTL